MKKLNNKSKKEQVFILFALCIVCFSFLCVAGCGKQSCEPPKCGKESADGFSAYGCSIPACGGCFTPERGCDSCLWPQSCKVVGGKLDQETTDEEGNEAKDTGNIVACDTRYYGGGCLGCGQSEKMFYCGWMSFDIQGEETKGLFYGNSDKGEKLIGCVNGCGGCVGSEALGGQFTYELEELTGIN